MNHRDSLAKSLRSLTHFKLKTQKVLPDTIESQREEAELDYQVALEEASHN